MFDYFDYDRASFVAGVGFGILGTIVVSCLGAAVLVLF